MTFNRDELLLLSMALQDIIKDYKKVLENIEREGNGHPFHGMKESMTKTLVEYMELLEKVNG